MNLLSIQDRIDKIILLSRLVILSQSYLNLPDFRKLSLFPPDQYLKSTRVSIRIVSVPSIDSNSKLDRRVRVVEEM